MTGDRRQARRVIRARRAPLGLNELSRAGIRVWPGLLLLALAEAIEPRWTDGERFVIAWAIQGTPGALLYLAVDDGQPVAVSHRPPGPTDATLYLSEASFLALMAAAPPSAGERILISGRGQAVERLLAWTDRVQGLTAR